MFAVCLPLSVPFVYCSFVRFGTVTARKARRYAGNCVLLVVNFRALTVPFTMPIVVATWLVQKLGELIKHGPMQEING